MSSISTDSPQEADERTTARANELVVRARAAQVRWAELSLKERASTLKAAARRLLERRREIVKITGEELGKAPADALFTEGLGPLDAVSAYIRVIEASPQGKVSLNPIAFPKKTATIELVPRGVVGVIAPWNFPVAGLYRSVFPALLLGNAVVLKPSEHSPRSSGWFVEVLSSVLPEGLLTILSGAGEAGAALLEAGIDACVFTGSSRTGALVEGRCRELGVYCSAELGGNDGAIVLADCDLQRTVAGLTHFALQNAGQACGAVEVIYADSRIARVLAERLADACKRLRPVGNDGAGSLAPLATEAQFQLVLSHIEDARARGAEVLSGGRAEGRYIEPTVLFGCTSAMKVVQEESFGPLLPVVSVDGPDEAIRRINEGRYGLTASIWTTDSERAERLSRRLDVGVVTVNNHGLTGAIAELPWSGRRESGRGIANSGWSLLTFARPKALLIDRSEGPEPYWMPFDADLVELGDRLAEAQLGQLSRAYQIPLLLRRRLQSIRAFFGI